MYAIGESIAQRDRYDRNVQPIVGPETDLVAGHTNNARISRPEHFDAGSTPQTKLLETVNMVRRSMNPADPRRLAGSQLLERNRAIMHGRIGGSRHRFLGTILLLAVCLQMASTFATGKVNKFRGKRLHPLGGSHGKV
jgi:hypothetical protein